MFFFIFIDFYDYGIYNTLMNLDTLEILRGTSVDAYITIFIYLGRKLWETVGRSVG